MTIQELANKLKEMYLNSPDGEKVAMIHLFGIQHSKEIKASGATFKELADLAEISPSYATEISKGSKLAKYVRGDRKQIAVLIDADNAQLRKLKAILDKISNYGHIAIKRAYGVWSHKKLQHWPLVLDKLAIEKIGEDGATGTNKSNDVIAMVINAMDLLYSSEFNLDTFVLVSGDNDFTGLIRRLRKSNIFVWGVGGKKASGYFKDDCDEFILTEDLDEKMFKNPAEKEKMTSIFHEAWEQCDKDDDGWVLLSHVGDFLNRDKPDFDPKDYGCERLWEVIELCNDFEIERDEFGASHKYRPKNFQQSTPTDG